MKEKNKILKEELEDEGTRVEKTLILYVKGNKEYLKKRYKEAKELYEKSLGIVKELGEESLVISISYQLALTCERLNKN